MEKTYGTVRYRTLAVTQYSHTVQYCIIRETATFANYKISPYHRDQMVVEGFLRLSNSLAVSRLERVLDFFLFFFYAYVSSTSASAEASVAYAATDTCLVNVQP